MGCRFSSSLQVDTGSTRTGFPRYSIGATITKANADDVRTATGFAIGGVAPVGHPEPLRTVIDVALSNFDVVWAAGGHPHCVFPTNYDELLRITGGEAAEVGA